MREARSYLCEVYLALFKPSNEIAVAGTRTRCANSSRSRTTSPASRGGSLISVSPPGMRHAAISRFFVNMASRPTHRAMEPQQKAVDRARVARPHPRRTAQAELDLDLYSRNPSPVFSLDSVDLVDGVGTLLMAELDGEPVGCGAFRVMDDMPGSAEIKRMYVTLAGRSKKIGAAILAELERVAEAIGVRRFALEAGLRQPEAKQL